FTFFPFYKTTYNQISATEEDISGSLIGYTRAILDEIYDLYCQHTFLVGFSVRKSTIRVKQGSNIITEKQFVCSAAGKTNHGKKEKREKKNQITTKESTTEESTKKKSCYNKDRALQYEIIHHSLSHNHPLTRQQWNHLHCFERTMTREKGGLIETMQELGLRPMESYRYMITEAGGEDCIGHTIRDHLNYCNRLKMKAIEDAQAVIDKLYQNMSDDLEFFFTEYIWMVMEECRAMGDKCPTTIFTDQDTAMTKAIEKDASFKDAFQKCLSGCSSEEEFEKTWHEMITK
ncbi:Protein FAR1-RELATED SEQUENCE 5, partial [Bienertia sinuspersici]